MFNSIEFMRNKANHTLDELAPYIDQHVAWSIDGKQILAHAPDGEQLLKEIQRLGLTEYVLGYVWDPNLSHLGGLND
jgi:hypothetical protein